MVVVSNAGSVTEALKKRSWKVVREAVPNQLLGADGEHLLHRCGQDGMHLLWVELPGTSTSTGTAKERRISQRIFNLVAAQVARGGAVFVHGRSRSDSWNFPGVAQLRLERRLRWHRLRCNA